nr:hypothetical protein [Propionicimonas sp.]
MSEDFDREERAFVEALRGAVADEGFRPLDPEAVKPIVRRRTAGPWARTLAAAAGVAIVAGAGVLVLPGLLSGSGASASASMEAVPAAAGAAAASEDQTANDMAGGAGTSLASWAAPAAGYRWESYRDVAVQVPDDWGYASAPRSDYCLMKTFPDEPYVDLARGAEPVRAIACAEPLADDDQAVHLSFSPADGEEPWSAPSEVWRQYTRELGEARITVTAQADQAGLAEEILDSAIVTPDGADPNGCPVTYPAAGPVELSRLDPSRIAVCLYEADGDRGAFRASVVLTDSAAAKAWQAVQSAPGGGGPDGDPAQCGASAGWPLLLFVGEGRVPVTMSVGGCAGNGVSDAAAASKTRKLTSALCRALLVDPVRISVGSGPAGELCAR